MKNFKHGVYAHLRTENLYKTLLCAENANNNESDLRTPMVVYSALSTGLYYVRNLDEFLEIFTFAGD